MLRLLSALLLACSALGAQTLVDAARFPASIQHLLDRRDGNNSLKCEVTPIKPVLNFGFRFQAGYVVRIPLRQYSGTGHVWGMVMKVTPEGGDHPPVHFGSSVDLPNVPETKAAAEIGGGYLLGEGRYAVEFTLFDETNRVCRKSWNVSAARSRSDRKVKIAMLPDTAGELSLRGSPAPMRHKDDIRPLRITILLHAAPIFPRRTRLRAGDTLLLAGSLSALLERLPARQVRLVVFNLDQQNEVFREDNFDPDSVNKVARAMSRQELGVIDYTVLQNRRGNVEFLADLVNKELDAREPSDVVIFFGPASRYFDKIPESVLEKPAGTTPQFFCFQFKPYFRRDANFPDVISSLASKLKGKTIMIHSPADFANAIDQLESRVTDGK
jgi:hypothetical protein